MTQSQTPTPAAAEAIEERQDDGTADIARRRANEAQRAERKLGLLLVAPAVTIMLAVAAYPIIYAFWLSLNKADLRRPDANEFIGFANYATVLSSPIWWRAFGVTMFITIVSAFFELADSDHRISASEALIPRRSQRRRFISLPSFQVSSAASAWRIIVLA